MLAVFSSHCFAQDKYLIEHMKDNVYRFTSDRHKSVFMVTDEGIFMGDPIDAESAEWLDKALKARFNKPVKYMAYSHNHPDHIQGGELFANQGATVIAHDHAEEDIEWHHTTTALADITFDDEMTIHLGDSSVLLKYYGPNNGLGSISMRFMPANVLHVVDWIVLGRMPYKTMPGYDIPGMIRSTQAVLDEPPFDLLVGGHGDAGTRADVEYYLAYLKALYGSVSAGMLQGKSLDTLKAEIDLSEFSDIPMFKEWRADNIEGVYKKLNDMSYLHLRKPKL
jgi:glyoxylase-like metal-dependent hydrolase (beta-lactamase superfamily II)